MTSGAGRPSGALLTRRGRLLIAAALSLYLLGWGFGMREASMLAVGIAIAVAAAMVYVRVAVRPMELTRRVPRGTIEGSDVQVRIEIQPSGGIVPPRAVVLEHVDGVGSRECEVLRVEGSLKGSYRLPAVPRGRYELHGAALRVDDPFGLERGQAPLDRDDALSVYPRLVELDSLFSDGGPPGGHGRRYLLSRVAGYDLHGVRDYQQGESLRAVHWKTSARLRKLMVKEFEDTPRDESIVVLDAAAESEVGQPPDSAFEMAVRAAGSLLRRLASSGQRSGLVVNALAPVHRSLATFESDWPDALELLAALKPNGRRPLCALLGERGAAVDAARVWVVTADLRPANAEAIAALSQARRDVAVVWIDAATWRDEPVPANGLGLGGALLASRNIALARVGRGDDLARALSSTSHREQEGRVAARA
jgi:uncharacterized protein (DUF58 family)